MKKLLFLMGLCAFTFSVDAKQSSQSAEVIKQKIIRQSIELSWKLSLSLQYCK